MLGLFALKASAQITVTLAPSDYNGYHVSCFGLKDGAIDATIAGGTAPYSHSWSNGAQTEDVTGLSSGLYILRVTDALGEVGTAEVTLIEPGQMKVRTEPFKYPNGHNVSCHDCFNGSIDLTVHGGVLPYTYNWGDEVYTQDRSGLGALSYSVVVTDANGCEERSEKLLLTQPERKDWTMEGNANTDAEQHFFGTTDSTDVVFKSNGQEQFRLLAGGGAKLTGLGGGGILKGGGDGLITVMPNEDLQEYIQGVISNPNLWELEPFWKTNGNTLENQQQVEAFIGSVDNHPLRFRTNNILRMNLTQAGDLGIIQRLGVGFDLAENTLGNGASRVHIRDLQGGWLRFTAGDDHHWQFSRLLNLDDVECLKVTHTTGTPLGGQTPLVLQADGGARLGPNLRISSVGDVSISRDAGGNWLSFHQGQSAFPSSYFGVHNPNVGGRLEFYYKPEGDDFTVWKILNLHENGKVSIGDVSTQTPNYDYRLYVEGGILTEKVRVALKSSSQWADYVFKDGYQVQPLEQVECFIKDNGHLPGMPSADCMVEEGLDVVAMNALLLEKIEELVLHVIALNKRIASLESK